MAGTPLIPCETFYEARTPTGDTFFTPPRGVLPPGAAEALGEVLAVCAPGAAEAEPENEQFSCYSGFSSCSDDDTPPLPPPTGTLPSLDHLVRQEVGQEVLPPSLLLPPMGTLTASGEEVVKPHTALHHPAEPEAEEEPGAMSDDAAAGVVRLHRSTSFSFDADGNMAEPFPMASIGSLMPPPPASPSVSVVTSDTEPSYATSDQASDSFRMVCQPQTPTPPPEPPEGRWWPRHQADDPLSPVAEPAPVFGTCRQLCRLFCFRGSRTAELAAPLQHDVGVQGS